MRANRRTDTKPELALAARPAPARLPLPQGLPARPGQRPAGPAGHRVHRAEGGRLRGRLLLACLPRARVQAEGERVVLGPEADQERRARPGERRGADPGRLDRGPALGARAARRGRHHRGHRPRRTRRSRPRRHAAPPERNPPATDDSLSAPGSAVADSGAPCACSCLRRFRRWPRLCGPARSAPGRPRARVPAPVGGPGPRPGRRHALAARGVRERRRGRARVRRADRGGPRLPPDARKRSGRAAAPGGAGRRDPGRPGEAGRHETKSPPGC